MDFYKTKASKAAHTNSLGHNTTRRNFLKTSAAGTIGGTAALGALSIARSAHAAGDGTIKIGMIGCGGRGSGAANQCMTADPGVKLVAMCDIFDRRLQVAKKNLAKAHPKQVDVKPDRCFTDFNGYQKVIDSCDLVLIACASKFHPMYSEAAIKAGKHVFVEKPHAIDPVGIRRMRKVCEMAKQKNLSLVSGLQSRFNPGWQETIKRIHDGAIGDIVAMQSMFLRGPYRLIKRDPKLSETQYQFSNWYHFRWLSGDDVPQSLVHNLDRMSWIMKDEMPKRAFALAGRSASFGEVYGDMFDHHTVVYEYASGVRLYALSRTEVGCYNNSGDIIMGTKGTCHLDRYRIAGETNWKYKGDHKNPYQVEHDVLVKSIRAGKAFNSGTYMNDSTLVGIMGQIAAYTGKSVTWEAAKNSDLRYGPTPEESNFDTKPPTTPTKDGNYPLPIPGITKLI